MFVSFRPSIGVFVSLVDDPLRLALVAFQRGGGGEGDLRLDAENRLQFRHHRLAETVEGGVVFKQRGRPLWISYDRALSGYWVPEMQEYGFEMEKCAQGPYTWSQPMREMQAAFSEHRVLYNNNPILRWCLLNTAKKSTKSDSIEMIQPVKLQANRRIDGCVSLLNAWVAFVKHYDDYMQYLR